VMVPGGLQSTWVFSSVRGVGLGNDLQVKVYARQSGAAILVRRGSTGKGLLSRFIT